MQYGMVLASMYFLLFLQLSQDSILLKTFKGLYYPYMMIFFIYKKFYLNILLLCLLSVRLFFITIIIHPRNFFNLIMTTQSC